MMKTRQILAVMLALVLALSVTACGGNSGEESSGDGQNPVMNYIGTYVCGRASIVINADDEKNGTSAIVTWSSSAAENSAWTMSGTFDSETLQFEYDNCKRTDYVYKEDGGVESQEDVYTDGHGIMTFKDGDPITLTWQDDKENVAADMVFEYATAPDMGDGVGMANPWQTADSAEAAAEGAGLDGFDVPEGITISLGDVSVKEYRYMDGMAEAYVMFPAVDVTIRKGIATLADPEGDISGDYDTYDNEWTQNIKGLEVKCFGNRKGEATRTIWSVDGVCYSILAQGMGGDDDYGLSADDLNSLINGMQ